MAAICRMGSRALSASLVAGMLLFGPNGTAGAAPYTSSIRSPAWTATYGQPDTVESATAIGATADGTTVFVAGTTSISYGEGDYGTIAYDALTGAQRWEATYSNGYDDEVTALATSPDGSTVFVTGSSYSLSSSDDYLTLAYDSVTGAERWEARLDGDGGADYAQALAVSPDGKTVFVTGISFTISGDHSDYRTAAYDASTGRFEWMTTYTQETETDGANAIAVSPAGDAVYVTGTAAEHQTTIAYDAASGVELWEATSGNSLVANHGVAVSPDGSDVFVAGSTYVGSSQDYSVVAYKAGTGASEWAATYDGPHGGTDTATALLAGSQGRVFVTGSSADSAGRGADTDYATVALDAATGGQLWAARYHGPADSNDVPVAMAITREGGRVFVTGYSSGSSVHYATVAYEAVSGLASGAYRSGLVGSATAIALSGDNRFLFVTGGTGGPLHDFGTVAYGLAP